MISLCILLVGANSIRNLRSTKSVRFDQRKVKTKYGSERLPITDQNCGIVYQTVLKTLSHSLFSKAN